MVFSIPPKKRTKNFCPCGLGQKFKFSSSFFGRIEDTKISFRDWLTFRLLACTENLIRFNKKSLKDHCLYYVIEKYVYHRSLLLHFLASQYNWNIYYTNLKNLHQFQEPITKTKLLIIPLTTCTRHRSCILLFLVPWLLSCCCFFPISFLFFLSPFAEQSLRVRRNWIHKNWIYLLSLLDF